MMSKKRLAVLTALLSGLGPFAVDTYLPSFQLMALELKATEVEVQQSLTFYLLPSGWPTCSTGPCRIRSDASASS